MSCERALPLLYDLIDGDIGRDEAIWLAGHVAACSACAARLNQMRAAEAIYAREIPVEAPPGLAARIAGAVLADVPARRPGWSWEPAAALLFLAALIAAALLAPELGGPAGSLARGAAAQARAALDAVLDLGRAIADGARGAASRLPEAPAALGWPPLAAAAVLLQVAGSAWLLGGRRAAERGAR